MGRQIITSEDVANTPGMPRSTGERAVPSTPDGYADRLVKNIPAEIVAAYLALDNAFKAANPATIGVLDWVAFLGLLIATPIYLYRLQNVSKKMQLAISTIAFAVWVYALGGPFVGTPIHSPLAATVVLILYTVGAALIEPKQ